MGPNASAVGDMQINIVQLDYFGNLSPVGRRASTIPISDRSELPVRGQV